MAELKATVERVPPSSPSAERAVLGACLLDRQALNVAAGILEPEDFYEEAHSRCFSVMLEMFEREKPVDALTLMDELSRRGLLSSLGGQAFIAELLDSVATTAHVEYHARMVKERSLRRKLIKAAGEISRIAFDEEKDLEEVLDEAEQAVFAVAEGKQKEWIKHVGEILSRAFREVERSYNEGKAVVGVPTGFVDLDRLTGGLQPGSLNILAARPSMGKTSFALNVVQHVAMRYRRPVLVFSLEMPAEQLVYRMLGSEAKVNVHGLRTGNFSEDAWKRLASAAGRLHQAPIYIDDNSSLSAMELKARCRRFKAEHKDLALVVVDYLQLLYVNKRVDNKQQEVAEISRTLKAVARELEVPLLALSQLSRAVEQRQDRRPQLSDLRDSGAIEQDADLVMFIYRPDVYQPEPPDSREPSTAEVIVAKHRNGPTGVVNLLFMKEYTTFESVAYGF